MRPTHCQAAISVIGQNIFIMSLLWLPSVGEKTVPAIALVLPPVTLAFFAPISGFILIFTTVLTLLVSK